MTDRIDASDKHRDELKSQQNGEWPIDWLRQTSPYINTHRGKTFVIWFGGDIFNASGFETLVHDLTLLSHLGVKLVLVHGMRLQVDKELQKRHISPVFNTTNSEKQQLRVTDADALTAIRSVISELRCQLESAFSVGLPNSPMSGAQISIASGNFIVAKPYGIRDGVDFQHTGEVRRIRKQSIQALLDAGMVVLLSPVGFHAPVICLTCCLKM